MEISTATREMLRAAAGRGASSDPGLLTRAKIKLLQNVSKLPAHGRGAPGMYVLADGAQTCAAKLRGVLGVIYPVWVERTQDNKFVGEHLLLPVDAEKDVDGFGWRLPTGNVLDKEARLAGVFENFEGELDTAKTAMKMARAINADATGRMKKLGLPLSGLAYEFGAQEVVNDRGQTFYTPTFAFLGAAGEPTGPNEDEIVRASAVCDLVEAAVAAAKEAADRQCAISPPGKPTPRPLITSGRAALKMVETPPPVERYDGPDDDSDDIPFN